MEKLLSCGALDVYTIPIGMKKSRPGILLSVLCKEQDKEKMVEAIFKHTTTIGIRESRLMRYTLERRIERVNTPFGEIERKVSSGYNVERTKYEYEELARISKETGKSISEIEEIIKNC